MINERFANGASREAANKILFTKVCQQWQTFLLA